MKRQIIGYLLISIFFGVLFVMVGQTRGYQEAAIAFAGAGALIACLLVGIHLTIK